MTIEKCAKTKEEAIELALSELGVTEADVEIEVVEEGSKGFLGIGSKDACVKVTYNPGEEKRATDFLNKIFEITNEDVTVESKVEGEVLKIKQPDRNEKCLCGSGLKYKKCCAGR